MSSTKITVMTMCDGTHRQVLPGQRVEVNAKGQFFLKWTHRNFKTGHEEKYSQSAGYAISKVEVVNIEEASYRLQLNGETTVFGGTDTENANHRDIRNTRDIIKQLKKESK